jgi:hypothetical protein
MCEKGRQHERYSIKVITLHYIFAPTHNASTLWRKVNAFDSCYRFLELSLWAHWKRFDSLTKAITCDAVTF